MAEPVKNTPRKVDREAVRGVALSTELVLMRLGDSVPVIDDQLYIPEVRGRAQDKITNNYDNRKQEIGYRLSKMDLLRLDQGFSPLEEVAVVNGTQYEDLIDRLDQSFRRGNYLLDQLLSDESPSFSVYLRFLPSKPKT